MSQQRQPKGVATGGQFASHQRPEPEGTLQDIEVELNAAARVDATQLDYYIAHPSRDVRCEAATNGSITQPQLDRLSEDPDWLVRREVATLPYPGCADRMASDVSVPVRVAAYSNPYLSTENRERLDNDRLVQAVLVAISEKRTPAGQSSAAGPAGQSGPAQPTEVPTR